MNKKTKNTGIGVLVCIVVVILLCSVSWIITCGVIKLITMCFGLTFKWSVATGIWLVMALLRTIFKNSSSTRG